METLTTELESRTNFFKKIGPDIACRMTDALQIVMVGEGQNNPRNHPHIHHLLKGALLLYISQTE